MAVTRFSTAFLDAGGVLVCPNWERAAGVLCRHGVAVEPSALSAAEPAVKRQLDVAPTVRVTNDEQRGFLYKIGSLRAFSERLRRGDFD